MEQDDRSEQKHLGNLIRKQRQAQGLTLQALCDRAGLSVGYLSQVERANATPSLGTLAQIADALSLGLEYFVARPTPADAITRADARAAFNVTEGGLTYETLGAEFPGHELSSFLITAPPGFVSETFQHEGEELIFLLEGEIEHMLDGQWFTLRAGDSLHYNGAMPHAWKTCGTAPVRMIWTGTLSVLQGRAEGHPP